VVISPSLVPDRWRHRGTEAIVIPLLPAEAAEVLRGEPAHPEVGPEEELLLELVACGLRPADIAGELGISARGVQHRLARLRRRFGVLSTGELSVLATRWGFGGGVKQRAKGSDGKRVE
jgi:DNA-binding NarL/FixJ family response regulator